MAIVEKMMRLHSPIDRMSHRSASSFRMLAATSRALKRAATSAWGMVGLVSARDASTLVRSQSSGWGLLKHRVGVRVVGDGSHVIVSEF